MAKKVKCIECINSMEWALPRGVTDKNIDYAKHCLDMAEKTIVCGHTMKTKRKCNEQYCKNFEKREYNLQSYFEEERSKLAEMIARYEESTSKQE